MVRRLLLTGALVGALSLSAQVVVEEVGTLQESFNRAQQEVQSYRFAPALLALDPVVTTLSTWESEGRLQPADETLLQKALELRAIASFNLGKVDEARADLAHLVRLKPEAALSNAVSAKLVRLFEEVRAELTGTLVLQIDPLDAQVKVDGRLLSGGLPPQLPLLKGLHRVEVSQAGYDPLEQELSVDPGQTQTLKLKLVPNARTIFFFVQPQGASLVVDGKVVGKAEARGDARAEWAAFLAENSYSASEWWAIPASHLAPGEHRVELRSPCYAHRRFTLPVSLDKENNLPGLIRPLSLERRTTRLTVTSRPLGAEVLLDGKPVGVTPLDLPNTCVGEHDLVVRKSGVGNYAARLSLPEEESFTVEANLRPTLVWAGLTRDQETTQAQRLTAEEALRARFLSALTFNGVVPKEIPPLLPDTFFSPGVPDAQVAATVTALCGDHGAQGLLAGKLVKRGDGNSVLFRLLLPGVPGSDEFSAEVGEKGVGETLSGVDAPAEVRPREFVLLADGARGLRIVQAPAGAGAPLPGDRLLSVESLQVTSPEEAHKAFSGREKLLLRVLGAGGERSWLYAPLALPPVHPLFGDTACPRRQWLFSRQEALSGGGDARGLAGRMGAALAALQLDLPSEALQILEGPGESALPDSGASLRPASLAYLRGVAFHRLGKSDKARAALQIAAADSQAALDPEGEFPVQPLARHLLSQLPAPPPPPAPAAGR